MLLQFSHSRTLRQKPVTFVTTLVSRAARRVYHTSESRSTQGDPITVRMNGLLRDNLENYSPASNLLHNEKIRELQAAGSQIYHFGFGQSPFPLMDHAVASLKKHADKSAYLPVAGIPELRKAICNFHRHYDDINTDIEDVIVGPGSKELIFLLMNVFQGDILVISPSWTTYKPQVLLSQHKAHVVSTDLEHKWKITPDILEKYVESNSLSPIKLLIFNNPDNPTGTRYTEQELKDLSAVCRKHKILVLADEIYARLTYTQDHVSLKKVYPEGTILSTGMSKWASAGGWRLGYLIFPKELAVVKGAVRSAASHTYTSVAAPIQYAIAEVLTDLDACKDYMFHTTRIMKVVAQYCHRELTSVGVKAILSEGGYYIFPDFEILKPKLKARGLNTCEDMVNAIFDESAVSVMAGGPAFLRPNDELTTRLCFVDFNGTTALAESRTIGNNKDLPADFVAQHCTKVYDGIQALKQWVLKQLQD